MCFQISSYGFVPPPQLVKVEKGTIPELYTPFELDGTRHWGKGATRYATPLWVFCGESQYTVKNFLPIFGYLCCGKSRVNAHTYPYSILPSLQPPLRGE